MPRLNKAGSNQADVQSYRLISNLTFISKVVERLVCRQLIAYLEQMDFYQSCSLLTGMVY